MATDQSQIQRLLESTTGVQNQVQTAQPTQPNNGNPNTANNANWMIPVQSNAAGQWWAPAPLVMPQQPSSANTIIQNLLRMRAEGRDPGSTFGTSPPGGPTGPSTPTTPTTPGTLPGTGPGASMGRPIGPISGPIYNNPHNWASNYENAQPNTNLTESGLGRQYALEWLRNSYQGNSSGSFNPNSNFAQSLRNLVSRAGNILGGAISGLGEDLNNMMSDAMGQDGLAGIARVLGTLAGIPGMQALLPRSYDENWQLSDADMQRAEQNMAATRERISQGYMDRTGDAAMNSFLQNMQGRGWTQEQAQAFWESMPEMSRQEWRRTQERMGWNNLWQGRDGPAIGAYTPGRSIPVQDNMDALIRSISANALAWDEQMRTRWTRYR